MAYGVMMLKVMSVLYPFKLYPILPGIKFYLELFREHLKTYCMNMNMQEHFTLNPPMHSRGQFI